MLLLIYSYVNVTVIKLLSNIYLLMPEPPKTHRECVTVTETQTTSTHTGASKITAMNVLKVLFNNDDYYSAFILSLFTGSNEKLTSSIIFLWLVHRFYKILGNWWLFSRFTSSGSPRQFFNFYCKSAVDRHCTSIILRRLYGCLWNSTVEIVWTDLTVRKILTTSAKVTN